MGASSPTCPKRAEDFAESLVTHSKSVCVGYFPNITIALLHILYYNQVKVTQRGDLCAFRLL